MQARKVLLIYTGGTIGMITDPVTGALKPFDFDQITNEVPELTKLPCDIETVSFDHPIDSSNMHPDVWGKLVEIIKENYTKFDGFVVLHGSDTMAYSASALSFMIHGLNKPVVFTGSQLPIGIIRTDGKENLITAIEIASTYTGEHPTVPEVSLYFEYKLYRGNRTTKLSSEHFNAFSSFNHPFLAEAGIDIKFKTKYINESSAILEPTFYTKMNDNVGVLKLFPGISKKQVEHFFKTPDMQAVVLETFGSGNATTKDWFLNELTAANEKGIIIVNVTQCKSGSVNQTKYETGRGLENAGVISSKDSTIEAAITKLMFLLGNYSDIEEIKKIYKTDLAGEITI